MHDLGCPGVNRRLDVGKDVRLRADHAIRGAFPGLLRRSAKRGACIVHAVPGQHRGDDAFHLLRVGQAEEHDAGSRGQFGQRSGLGGAARQQILDQLAVPMPDDAERTALFDEVLGHAEPDKADVFSFFGHLQLP